MVIVGVTLDIAPQKVFSIDTNTRVQRRAGKKVVRAMITIEIVMHVIGRRGMMKVVLLDSGMSNEMRYR